MDYTNVDGGEIGAKIAEAFKPQREAVAAAVAERNKPAAPTTTETTTTTTTTTTDGETKAKAFKAIASDELGVIIGVASVADVFDREDESVQKGALVSMAFDYCAKAERKFKLNHEEDTECELVGSWPGSAIVEKSGDKEEIVGIGLKADATHWFIAVRPKDPAVLAAAKAGEIVGFSWGGFAHRQDAA